MRTFSWLLQPTYIEGFSLRLREGILGARTLAGGAFASLRPLGRLSRSVDTCGSMANVGIGETPEQRVVRWRREGFDRTAIEGRLKAELLDEATVAALLGEPPPPATAPAVPIFLPLPLFIASKALSTQQTVFLREGAPHELAATV